MADLSAKKLPLQGDSLLGFDDFVKTYRENDPGAFAADTKTATNTTGTTQTQPTAPVKLTFDKLEETVRRKQTQRSVPRLANERRITHAQCY